jgi:hypothetical protein
LIGALTTISRMERRKKASSSFPAPAQIIQRCETWCSANRQHVEDDALEQIAQWKREAEIDGEPRYGLGDVAKMVQEGMAEREKKNTRLLGADLSDEQWEQRKAEMRQKAEEFKARG